MSELLNNPRIILYSQPMLQSQDLELLCTLVTQQGLTEDLEDWTLEQFLGLALHLFITSQSLKTRQTLARLLPKFGSAAVFPLVRIVQSPQVEEGLQTLALTILMSFTPNPLAIGLLTVLQSQDARALRPAVLQTLTLVGKPAIQALQSWLTPNEWQSLGLYILAQRTPSHEILEPSAGHLKLYPQQMCAVQSVAVA